MDQPIPFHYHLITGEILFRMKDSEETIVTRVNAIMADEGKQIPVRLLAKSQQILQMNFHKRMDDPDHEITVIDCVFINIAYLGQFTTEEFHKTPAGTEVKESEPKAKPVTNGLHIAQAPISLEEAVAEANKS